MAPIGPLRIKRTPEPIRRQVDVAAATAWEALVDTHATHAAGFVTLMAGRLPFDEAVSRYLAEMDVRDPMASSIRSRVLVALERGRGRAAAAPGGRGAAAPGSRPSVARGAGAPREQETEGLKRFRPDVLVKGIARRVRESEATEEWVRLAIARAEEAVIRTHMENAAAFAALLGEHQPLDEAVEDYIETLRISGGRAQAVYQRTMAVLADLHLPNPAAGEPHGSEPDPAPGDDGPPREGNEQGRAGSGDPGPASPPA